MSEALSGQILRHGVFDAEMLCWRGGASMSGQRETTVTGATARIIRNFAERVNATYRATDNDHLAHDITRLAGDNLNLDPIEQTLIGLQRAGHINRVQMVRLQARYLRETKP
jgi:hypothetical protein